jgi:Helix-turn-helix domain
MANKYTDVVAKLKAFDFVDNDCNTIGKFTASDKLVLYHLAYRTKDDGTCFPGFGDIAGYSLQSRRQVIRCIKKLESLQFLTITKSAKYKSNQYQLDLDTLCAAARLSEEEMAKMKNRTVKGRDGKTYIDTKSGPKDYRKGCGCWASVCRCGELASPSTSFTIDGDDELA